MNADKILTIVSLLVAILAVFVALDYWALILVLLGLLSGFMNSESDPVQRMVLLVAAIGLPVVANQLDAIPMIGGCGNSIIDNIARAISGMVIANFIIAMVDRVKSVSSD